MAGPTIAVLMMPAPTSAAFDCSDKLLLMLRRYRRRIGEYDSIKGMPMSLMGQN
jgi:hypothetical protein